MKNQIPQIGGVEQMTPEVIERIRSLIEMAGGARLIAFHCKGSYDTYHNVLRGTSNDYAFLNKMISKAKKILAKKLQEIGFETAA